MRTYFYDELQRSLVVLLLAVAFMQCDGNQVSQPRSSAPNRDPAAQVRGSSPNSHHMENSEQQPSPGLNNDQSPGDSKQSPNKKTLLEVTDKMIEDTESPFLQGVLREIQSGRAENVDKVNKRGATPLQIALAKGLQDVIQVLLNNGADPNVQDDNGQTPLHCAVLGQKILGGYEGIIKLLVQCGAKVDIKDEEGITPLKLAEEYAPAMVDILTGAR